MPSGGSEEREAQTALMRRAQAGDAEAFAGLVHAFAARLFRFIQALGVSAMDADDLVQETFIRAHRHLARYDHAWTVSTWLYTIARRLALNHHRDRRTSVSLDHVAVPAMACDDADGELWDHARAALGTRDFQVLWLRYGEDLALDELAAVLAMSPGSAKVALHRARQRLAAHLTTARPVDARPHSLRLFVPPVTGDPALIPSTDVEFSP